MRQFEQLRETWDADAFELISDFIDVGDRVAVRIIWRAPPDWPEPGPYVGREAVMRQFEQLRETWDADAFELISDFIDVGDRVVVRLAWRGAGHGPKSNMEFTGVITLRNGRIVAIQNFWDHTEALEAAGLSE